MQVIFSIGSSLFDCEMKIMTSSGTQRHVIPALRDEQRVDLPVTVDATSFSVELLPLKPASVPDGSGIKGWFAKTTAKTLFSMADMSTLRVGCRYDVAGMQDGDRLDITLNEYTIGSPNTELLWELYAVVLSFFELEQMNTRFEPTETISLNRRAFLKLARMFYLSDMATNIFLILLYPFYMLRVRFLTSRHRVRRTLLRYHRMSEEQRARVERKRDNW